MNKQRTIFIAILLVFGFFSQSKGQTLSGRQTEQIKNQVDAVFQQMVVYAEQLDFDKLSSGVDDSWKAGFIANGKYYANYADLINDVKQNAQGLGGQTISVKEKKITVLSEKIVLINVTGISKATIIDGREISANFLWSFVYEKTGEDWKVIFSHQSTSR